MKEKSSIKVIKGAKKSLTVTCGCLVEYVLCCPKIIPKG